MTNQTAIAGRVTKIDLGLPDDIRKVEVTTRPENGTLTVDPDQQTLSYVSTDPGFSGRMPVGWSVTHADGRVETVDLDLSVKAGSQQSGWGGGESLHMLRTDENDDVIVETGDNHRKVYVSGSDDALSKADIEQLEGRDFRSDWHFGQFLKDNPQYGGSEGTALDAHAGEAAWMALTGRETDPSSHWLMFERGYEYSMGRLIDRGTQGEDELHPIHVTAWGEGDAPVMTDRPQFFQEPSSNIVITDIAFADGIRILNGENLIFEDISVGGDEMIVQNAEGVTLRQSDFLDIIRDTATGPNWKNGADDRMQGVYAASSEGLLIEETLFDHTGWKEGYDLDGNGASVQPPTKFSHNVYLQFDTLDVTFRENVTMRAASTGAQLRGGAFAEDNLYLDNNVAGNFGGGWGVSDGVKSGNYSFVNGNLVTSAAHKAGLGEGSMGAMSMGFDDFGRATTLLGNIVAHLANPDDAEEIVEKYWAHDPINGNASRAFDDTIIYNWDTAYPYNGVMEHNTDGLDTAAMAETTIQRYAADLLGTNTATIDDLAQHLRQVVSRGGDLEVDRILNYFREGFGQDRVGERSETDTVTFVPSELGEGTRWDNRVNWDNGELPIDGDTVDLNGNHVRYGGSVDLAELRLGDTGALALGYGYLGVDELVGGGRLDIDEAGQFWVDAWSGSGTLDVNLDGGRFVNTGRMGGAVEIEATDGELVLATGGGRFDLDGGALKIVGDAAKIGFDGTDGRAAGLDLDGGTLGFVAEDGAFGQIGAFRTGAFGSHDVTSLVDLEGGRIEIDLGDMQGGGTHGLLDIDGLGGTPDEVVVTGLGQRDAVVRVDLAEDRIELAVSTGGSGQSRVEVLEETADETDAEAALWRTIPSEGSVPAAPETDPAPAPQPAMPEEEMTPEPVAEAPGEEAPAPEAEAPEDAPVLEEEAPETETPEEAPAPEEEALAPEPEAPEETPAPEEEVFVPEPEIEDIAEEPAAEAPEEEGFTLDLAAPDTGGMVAHDFTDGRDQIVGGADSDWIEGGRGNDHLDGGAGDDVLSGGEGQDRMSGGIGDDHLAGGGGNDHLMGQDGNDVLIGGDGWDRLFGNAGDDILAGGAGTDMLAGGAGADQFVFDVSNDLGAEDVDQIYDFDADEGDRIVVTGSDGPLGHDFDATADLPVLSVEIDGETRDLARFYGDGALELAMIDEGDGYLILG